MTDTTIPPLLERLRAHDDPRLYREADELMAEAANAINALTRERDEWAAKWHQMRKAYATARWPELNGDVTAVSASSNPMADRREKEDAEYVQVVAAETERLARAALAQKPKAEAAVPAEARYEALVRALKTHAGDADGWEFGLGRVKFGAHGALESFLWASQADIDAAVAKALATTPAPAAQQAQATNEQGRKHGQDERNGRHAQGASEAGGSDAGASGEGRGPEPHEHHQHRSREADAQRADDQRHSGGDRLPGESEVRADVTAQQAAQGAVAMTSEMAERIRIAGDRMHTHAALWVNPAPHAEPALVPSPSTTVTLGAQQAEQWEAVAWRCTGDGLKRYLTQRQYEAQTSDVQRWYEPYCCARCAWQPVAREALSPVTDEQILNFGPGDPFASWSIDDQLYFGRAIERAHGIGAASPAAQPAADAKDAATGNALLSWACERWRIEVQDRPMVNRNRRPLDDAWRQVIRYAGGDPDALVGPSHDALLAAMSADGEKA